MCNNLFQFKKFNFDRSLSNIYTLFFFMKPGSSDKDSIFNLDVLLVFLINSNKVFKKSCDFEFSIDDLSYIFGGLSLFLKVYHNFKLRDNFLFFSMLLESEILKRDNKNSFYFVGSVCLFDSNKDNTYTQNMLLMDFIFNSLKNFNFEEKVFWEKHEETFIKITYCVTGTKSVPGRTITFINSSIYMPLNIFDFCDNFALQKNVNFKLMGSELQKVLVLNTNYEIYLVNICNLYKILIIGFQLGWLYLVMSLKFKTRSRIFTFDSFIKYVKKLWLLNKYNFDKSGVTYQTLKSFLKLDKGKPLLNSVYLYFNNHKKVFLDFFKFFFIQQGLDVSCNVELLTKGDNYIKESSVDFYVNLLKYKAYNILDQKDFYIFYDFITACNNLVVSNKSTPVVFIKYMLWESLLLYPVLKEPRKAQILIEIVTYFYEHLIYLVQMWEIKSKNNNKGISDNYFKYSNVLKFFVNQKIHELFFNNDIIKYNEVCYSNYDNNSISFCQFLQRFEHLFTILLIQNMCSCKHTTNTLINALLPEIKREYILFLKQITNLKNKAYVNKDNCATDTIDINVLSTLNTIDKAFYLDFDKYLNNCSTKNNETDTVNYKYFILPEKFDELLIELIVKITSIPNLFKKSKSKYNNQYINYIMLSNLNLIKDENIPKHLLPMVFPPKKWENIIFESDVENYTGGFLINDKTKIMSLIKHKKNINIKTKLSAESIQAINLQQEQHYFINTIYLQEHKIFWKSVEEQRVCELILKYFQERVFPIFFVLTADFRGRMYPASGILSIASTKAFRFIIETKPYLITRQVIQQIKRKYLRLTWNKLATDDECDKFILTLDNLKNTCFEKSKDIHDINKLKSILIETLEKPNVNTYTGSLGYYDHSCSGFTLLVLLFANKKAAKLLNLIEDNKINDFYLFIANNINLELKKKDVKKDFFKVFYKYKIHKSLTYKKVVYFFYNYCFTFLTEILNKVGDITKTENLVKMNNFLKQQKYPIIFCKKTKKYYGFFTYLKINKKNCKLITKLQNTLKLIKSDSKKNKEAVKLLLKLKIFNKWGILFKECKIYNFLENFTNKRDIIKPVIMCIPYLISKYTAINKLKNILIKSFLIKKENNELLKTWKFLINKKKCSLIDRTLNNIIYQVSILLYDKIYLVLNNETSNIIQGILKISNLVNLLKLKELVWETPTLTKVQYSYLKMKKKKVYIGRGKDKFINVFKKTKDICYKKHKQSIIAHLIHSLDSSLLIKVINTWKKKFPNEVILTIHDAYGIPFTHVNELKIIVNNELIKFLEANILENFLLSLLNQYQKETLLIINDPNIKQNKKEKYIKEREQREKIAKNLMIEILNLRGSLKPEDLKNALNTIS